MTTIQARIYMRRDDAATWATINPTLGEGEPAFETDTGLLKVGDGSSDWNSLPYVNSQPSGTRVLNQQAGTSYTPVLADADYNAFLTLTNASAVTLTVPTNATTAFPVGSVIEGANLGAGDVTITPAGGVTINPSGLTVEQYSAFGIIKLATNTWLAYGKIV